MTLKSNSDFRMLYFLSFICFDSVFEMRIQTVLYKLRITRDVVKERYFYILMFTCAVTTRTELFDCLREVKKYHA